MALIEGTKGMLVLAAGLGLFALAHRDLQSMAEQLVRHLHLNPARHLPRIFLHLAANLSDRRLWLFASAAIIYSTISFVEAATRSTSLGLARSELYPALAATAVSQFTRGTAFFGENFYRQKIGELQGNLELSYTVFDFGARAGRINAAKAELLAANFSFNDAHRRVIYQVEQAYYEEEVNRSKQRKRRLFRGRRRTAPTRTLLSELPMSLKSSSWLHSRQSGRQCRPAGRRKGE